MRKCKLSIKTRTEWIKVLKQTLKQDRFGDINDCTICNHIDIKENDKINKLTIRKQCISRCIVHKFNNANYIKFEKDENTDNDIIKNLPCEILVFIYKSFFTSRSTIKGIIKEIIRWLEE